MQHGICSLLRSAARFRSQRCPGYEGYACARNCTVAASSAEHRHPPVALVQGGSRGLGLEYVKQLLDRPEQRVVATCRNPESCVELQHLQSKHPAALELIQLDVTSDASIAAAADQVSSKHSYLTLLINAAGLLHIPDTLSPETALSRLESSSLHQVFAVNTFGPILVSKAFMPLLSKGAKDGPNPRDRPSVIVNMSARVGSISDNQLGGWYSYRASKTALNQLTKTMAIECTRRKSNVSCIMLHPGTVDTDLSAPFQKNVRPEKLFTKERAVRQLLEIIDGTTNQSNGRFYAWDKQEIPW
ncbi:hypothetical protein ABBQ38_000459 [Trebouxia sp. C0009 RCD-2024]